MGKNLWLWLAITVGLAVMTGTFVVKFKTRKDFYDSLLPDALRLERETGIAPHITLAQAAHESNYGNDAGLATQFHNLFGIKPGSSWKGDRAIFATKETIGGKVIPVKSEFRAYPSFFASMQDWATLLVNLYPAAYQAAQRNDILAFADGLRKGRAGAYATDPNYGAKLVSAYQTIGGLA